MTLRGSRIRALRRRRGLSQKELAERLGISAPYMNLLEREHRAVTAPLLVALAREFGLSIADLSVDDGAELRRDLQELFADDQFEGFGLTNRDITELIETHPAMARAVRGLGDALRAERLAQRSAGAGAGRATPADEVSDFVQRRGNHFHELESAAGDLVLRERLDVRDLDAGLRDVLDREGVDVHIARPRELPDTLRRFDRERRRLLLSELLPPRSRVFHLAHQLGWLRCAPLFDEILRDEPFSSDDARTLARVVLANYYAGAVMMPYGEILAEAERARYDLELLGHRFRASLEQVAHRLTTLRRPGQSGIPLHLVRVDLAGNISKRFSGTGIGFSRSGGACALWNVFQAFLTPGRFRVQLSEMPDGERFFCVAVTVPKGQGGYHAPHTVHAIGLGCRDVDARAMVYADGVATDKAAPAVPIGVSCPVCDRSACSMRAQPPLHRAARLDPDVRGLNPYAR